MVGKQKAFTLVELLVTVTVLAILTAIAVPQFRTLIANRRAAALPNEMLSALSLARSEAVKRGTAVSVCASNNNGASCTATAWQDGWIVFIGTASAPTVIKAWGANSAGASVTVTKTSDSSSLSFLQFTGMGLLAKAASDVADADGNLVAIQTFQQHCSGNYARRIGVGPSGRVNQIAQSCPP